MKNKTFFTFIFLLSLLYNITNLYSQSTHGMSYQAVIRDQNDALLTNTPIRMEINIRHGSPSGIIVYNEIQAPITNSYGLISIEIGVESGFEDINWADGPFFIETKIAIEPPFTNYTIISINQFLTVPYAFHSKVADNLINPIIESDPMWMASPSFLISESNIFNWDSAFSWGDHYGLYKPITYFPTWDEILNRPTTLIGFGITDAMDTTHAAYNISLFNIQNWETAFSWGNHMGLYRPIDYQPIWDEIINRPVFSNVAFSGDYQDLANTPTIPIVPTSLSSFTNDVGYLSNDQDNQQLSVSLYGDTLRIQNGGFVIVPGISAANLVVTTPIITTSNPLVITSSTASIGGNILFNGGADIIQRGICWNINPNPTVSHNSNTIGAGNESFSSIITGLTPNTMYYARAYATNCEGTSYGNEVIFTTIAGDYSTPGAGVTYNGYTYATIVFGNGQEWMAENLRTTHFSNGDTIPNFILFDQVVSDPGWVNYNHDPQLGNIYGKLYNFRAVQDSRNICPSGWHIPNENEWNLLINYIDPTANLTATGVQSYSAGCQFKTSDTLYWNSPNAGATNGTGFSALPGGIGYNNGTFNNLGETAYFWTSVSNGPFYAYYRQLNSTYCSIYRGSFSRFSASSVRCIKNSN